MQFEDFVDFQGGPGTEFSTSPFVRVNLLYDVIGMQFLQSHRITQVYFAVGGASVALSYALVVVLARRSVLLCQQGPAVLQARTRSMQAQLANALLLQVGVIFFVSSQVPRV